MLEAVLVGEALVVSEGVLVVVGLGISVAGCKTRRTGLGTGPLKGASLKLARVPVVLMNKACWAEATDSRWLMQRSKKSNRIVGQVLATRVKAGTVEGA